MISSILLYLGGLVSGFVLALLTMLSKSNVENALTIKRIAVRVDQEIEHLDRGKGVISEPKPLAGLATEMEQAIRLARWYFFFSLLLGLPPKKNIGQVPQKFREYMKQHTTAFGPRQDPNFEPEIRKLLRLRKSPF